MQDLGREGWTDGPEAGEGGRLGVLGARGGVPGGQELGNLPADVQGGRRGAPVQGWGLWIRKGQGGEGSRAICRGDPRRGITGKSKWRVKLVRLPGGGEQAGECGQEHEAGQESQGGREAVGTE